MRIHWPDAARHLVQVAVLCALVAVLTHAIWPEASYPAHLVKSLAIGLVIWLVMEFGRLLVDARHCYPGQHGAHGWPRGWRGGLLAVLGIGTGFLGGLPLGDWLTGTQAAHSARDAQLVLLITIAAGAVASFYFHARGRTAALEAARAAAERDAGEARLLLLQSQLEPHMLFNTLANLRALIATDPPAAQTMLDRLDRYLRATLAASRGGTQHPLGDEFERLSDYLELMAVRMGPRLAVTVDLPQALRELPVPPLLLQPLVENAIRHGLEPSVEGGRIEVRAERAAGGLILSVMDTGVGFDPAAPPRGRFGLEQLRQRVATSSGGRGRVELHSAPGRGTTIRVHLPLA